MTNPTTNPPRESTATPSRFPYGMHNTSEIYSSLVSTDMGAYEDLPEHHLISIRNLITSSPDVLLPGSDSEENGRNQESPEWDYTGLHDRNAFSSFQVSADYCLTCSDDSSEGEYDPTRECLVAALEEFGDEDVGTSDAAARANRMANPHGSPPNDDALTRA